MPAAELPEEVRPYASEPTRRLGRHILVKKIGKGGQSEVWRAWDTLLARPIAIKILKDADPEDVVRFRREANILANLRHPNIAPVFGMEQEGERAFIAMQLVDGETIDRMNAPLAKKVEFLRDAARALHFAHRQGIIHRDVKPSNIMATADGHLYLMDFGIARPVRKGATITGTDFLVGTPAYMSPEQARGGRCDERTDVYALGATLYRLATHSDPFYGDDPMQVLLKVSNEAPPRPTTLEPSIPRPVEDIIRVAMSKEPAARHQTAEEFAGQLDAFLAGKKVRAAPREPVRVPQAVWIGALGVVTVAAVLWAIFKPPAARAVNPPAPRPAPVAPGPAEDAAARDLKTALGLLDNLRELDGAARENAVRQARGLLARVLKARPGDPDALFHIARLETLLGNTAEALDAAGRAVDAAPHSAEAVLLRARLRVRRALSLKTRFLAGLEPAGADPASTQMFLRQAAEDTPEIRALFAGADADLKQFAGLSPAAQSADSEFAKGLSAFNAGRFPDARRALTAASSSPWLGTDARLLLGLASYLADDFMGGEAALSKAGEGDEVVEARLLLAMLLSIELMRRPAADASARTIVDLIGRDFAALIKIRPKSADWLKLVPLQRYWQGRFAVWIAAAR